MSEMTPEERKERIDQIKFKMKAIGIAALFIHSLKQGTDQSDEKELTRHRMEVIYED